MDSSRNAATSKSDKRNQDSKEDANNYVNKSNARPNNDYRPLSSVSDDLDMSQLRQKANRHNSSMVQSQQGKRTTKTEIVTQGRRHNFEIQPSRYRGTSHTHLGQLPSIEGTGSTVAGNKTGYNNSEYS